MMSKMRSLITFISLFVLAALVLDLGNPLFDKPARDGGFFLYAGSQILSGKTPYLDFWDSKGPSIFYVNALGLFVGGGSRWGMWLVEFVFILVTVLILYKLLLKTWGFGAAAFGSFMAAFGLRVVLGYGNYTEEYALLFNAIALYLFWDSLNSGKDSGWNYFWIGALFGLSFTFRANNIGGLFGILISVFLFYIFNRKYREAVRTVSILLAGFAAPLLLWILYFQTQGAAAEMIFASIIFNFSYASAENRTFLDYFGGFGDYGISWYGWFTAAGFLIFAYGLLRRLPNHEPISVLDIFLLAWFPVEIFLSNLSGRNYPHYYISWTPAIAVYSAIAYVQFEAYVLKQNFVQKWNLNISQLVFSVLILFLIFSSLPALKRYGDTFYRLLFARASGMEYVDPMATYIRDHTQPDDLVLTWYPEMRLNFMAQRISPVRLLYYPLFLEGTLTPEAERGYIEDLTGKRPQMIVDCSLSVNAIPSLEPVARAEQYSKPELQERMYIHPGMDQIFSFVSENYHLEDTVETCFIFRLNSDR